MDRLSADSLDWALKHIIKFGDTDLLPIPFEYEAISHAWGWLRDEILAKDLGNYQVGATQRLLVPKSDRGFRVVTQLDPVDALVYTAMVYEIAENIEKARVPRERNIACSYRVTLDAKGTFFPADNGWPAYHAQSRKLARGKGIEAILVADISDFYNQIYHHRLENALDDAGATRERRKNIASFLSQLTATQSRGIPVGPYASIILAETCLNDVDSFLLRKGYRHTRYVDDFRIFCRSKRSAVLVLHNLTEYLHTAHRLSLVPVKTRIRTPDSFVKSELRDPVEEEQAGQASLVEQTLQELSAALTPDYSGDLPDPQVGPEILNEATRENLKLLFSQCVEARPLHIGLARHLLRRATRLRTNVLLDKTMKNLDLLAPVLRDVVRYLKVAVPRTRARQYGSDLIEYLKGSVYGDIPYLHLWILELFRLRPDLAASADTMRLAEAAEPLIGMRMTALLAGSNHQADWIRGQKEIWRNHKDWDRRAVLASASVLPRDERTHWLGMIQGTSSGLDRAVAQYIASK